MNNKKDYNTFYDHIKISQHTIIDYYLEYYGKQSEFAGNLWSKLYKWLKEMHAWNTKFDTDFEAVSRQVLRAYYCTYLGCCDRQSGRVRQTGTNFRHKHSL